jgi:bridging integrator 3
VIDPISRFCAYFPDINEAIKKRSHKLLDYDALRAKVKRLVDKPSDDPTKLPRAEKEAAMAREIYEDLNEQLTTELPQLIDLRVPYLDPSFEALVKIQLRFCKEGYERMAQVQQYLDPQVREDYAQVCYFLLRGQLADLVGSFGSEGRAGLAADERFEHCWKCVSSFFRSGIRVA